MGYRTETRTEEHEVHLATCTLCGADLTPRIPTQTRPSQFAGHSVWVFREESLVVDAYADRSGDTKDTVGSIRAEMRGDHELVAVLCDGCLAWLKRTLLRNARVV